MAAYRRKHQSSFERGFRRCKSKTDGYLDKVRTPWKRGIGVLQWRFKLAPRDSHSPCHPAPSLGAMRAAGWPLTLKVVVHGTFPSALRKGATAEVRTPVVLEE